MATVPAFGLRRLNSRQWLHTFRPPPPPSLSHSLSCSASPSSLEESEEDTLSNTTTTTVTTNPNNYNKTKSFFPKRGQSSCDTGPSPASASSAASPAKRAAMPRSVLLYSIQVQVTKLKTITPHMDAVEAPCEYAPHCGGCKAQNLLYEAQFRLKEQQVHELVVHVGKFSSKDPEFISIMKPIVPCDIQFNYRNKSSYPRLCRWSSHLEIKKWVPKELLQEQREGADDHALGLHAPGFFDRVLNVDKCLLQSEPANRVLAAIQDCWRDPQLGLSSYNCHSHLGFLKYLMLRTGRDVRTGLPELMVNFVTSSYKPELLKPLVEKCVAIPEVAEVLYKIIEECACLKGDDSEIVLDLFCGTGTIGLTLAKRVRHVYCYEVVPQAISDARWNAKLNGICNASFVQGDLNKIDDNFGKGFPKPDIVISDPNRPGMHIKLIKYLLKLKAARIIYVSCNPATCARDIDYLCHGVTEKNVEGCYRLRSLQPVDTFPHTPHTECVCLLELVDSWLLSSFLPYIQLLRFSSRFSPVL
ncbi:hypothetical protein RJ639_014461 [Escallonia herrerae]|uniref:RNA methyltransferase n=1 Tax=Escallonia herrerae TaxID=1293975 RepID=A0AA88VPL2_9ASTE|nr:hypothetical protein RJ639_014461 [Escallonia herrerae]